MTVTAQLSDTALDVEAGEHATTELRVRNEGDVVDQFGIDVLGEPAGWVTVVPAALNLMPGTEGVVIITFAPPRSSEVPAGTADFAVRVRSREYPEISVVEEGVVEVAGFTELTAELVPAKRRGRRAARYRLAVENSGNRPEGVQLAGFDVDGDELDLRISPPEVITRPGTVTVLRVRAAARRRFLRGEPRPHPFQLEVSSVETRVEALVVEGMLVQQRLLPAWLLPAAAALAGLVVTLTVLWFAVLEPSVRSVAEDQVSEQVDRANAAAARADEAADRATGGGSGGGGNGQGSSGGGDSGGGTNGGNDRSRNVDGGADGRNGSDGSGGGDAAQRDSEPTSFRIAVDAPAVKDNSYRQFRYTAPGDRAMDVGDLVLQNPRGDTGFLRILIGEQVVLETGLANFRDLDYHYVDPLRVSAGRPVVVEVNCTSPGAGRDTCSPAVSFSGTLR